MMNPAQAAQHFTKFMLGQWYGTLRQIDLETLWPTCIENAGDLDHAKAAFAVHALNDKAWLVLAKDEIIRRIDNLR